MLVCETSKLKEIVFFFFIKNIVTMVVDIIIYGSFYPTTVRRMIAQHSRANYGRCMYKYGFSD